MNTSKKLTFELVVDNTLYMFGDEAIRLQRIPEYEANKEDIVELVCRHFEQSTINLLNLKDETRYQESRAMLAGLLFEKLQMSVAEIEKLMPPGENSHPLQDYFRLQQDDSYFASLFVHLWLQAGTHPDFRDC